MRGEGGHRRRVKKRELEKGRKNDSKKGVEIVEQMHVRSCTEGE
jgi:hypothetical protein